MEKKHRSRKARIEATLGDDVMKIFNRKFEVSGLKSRSEFVRQLIIYGLVCYMDFSEIKENNMQLAAIGRNINQIARKVNTTGSIFKEDIKELKEAMDKVWQLQRSIQSKLLSEMPSNT